jgi:hypothetical protein
LSQSTALPLFDAASLSSSIVHLLRSFTTLTHVAAGRLLLFSSGLQPSHGQGRAALHIPAIGERKALNVTFMEINHSTRRFSQHSTAAVWL